MSKSCRGLQDLVDPDLNEVFFVRILFTFLVQRPVGTGDSGHEVRLLELLVFLSKLRVYLLLGALLDRKDLIHLRHVFVSVCQSIYTSTN